MRSCFVHIHVRCKLELWCNAAARLRRYMLVSVLTCACVQAVSICSISAGCIMLPLYRRQDDSVPIWTGRSGSRDHFRTNWRIQLDTCICCQVSSRCRLRVCAQTRPGGMHLCGSYLQHHYMLIVNAKHYCQTPMHMHADRQGTTLTYLHARHSSFVHAHNATCRRTVDWARRRYQMGLAGFGMPWEEGEDAWLMRGSYTRPDLEDMTKTSDGGLPDGGDDVPAELLADEDSKFVQLDGIKVHYKEVLPPVGMMHGHGQGGSSVAVVLVHGFGGGVFAWRHVMEPLAMQCQCRVVAFDRPAFGLTSRPRVSGDINHYQVSSQAELVLQLCAALGLKQVVLVAHADGCLVTLRAAAMAAMAAQAHK